MSVLVLNTRKRASWRVASKDVRHYFVLALDTSHLMYQQITSALDSCADRGQNNAVYTNPPRRSRPRKAARRDRHTACSHRCGSLWKAIAPLTGNEKKKRTKVHGITSSSVIRVTHAASLLLAASEQNLYGSQDCSL
jgi:hypothetical protein